jgi:hypothetical protein
MALELMMMRTTFERLGFMILENDYMIFEGFPNKYLIIEIN